MIKLIFKAYKKTEKIFFYIYIYKMANNYYQKKQRKAFKKVLWKVPKSFWRRKRQKAPLVSWAIIWEDFLWEDFLEKV